MFMTNNSTKPSSEFQLNFWNCISLKQTDIRDCHAPKLYRKVEHADSSLQYHMPTLEGSELSLLCWTRRTDRWTSATPRKNTKNWQHKGIRWRYLSQLFLTKSTVILEGHRTGTHTIWVYFPLYWQVMLTLSNLSFSLGFISLIN